MINSKSIRQKYFLLIKLVFWTIAIILGLAQAWGNRYQFFSGDIISYIEMGEAYLRGDWEVAIHGYFSPLYPLILSSFLSIFTPSMYWEIFAVKIVNFFIYLFSLVGFELFLSGFINFYKKKSRNESQEQYLIPDWIWLVLGYFLFLWAAIKWIGVHTDTPDMLVAGLVYLAMGIVLRINTGNDSWINFAFFGIVLGLGYLAKTVMLPAAFVFFLICFLSLKQSKNNYYKILLSFLLFLLIVTPLISLLSIQKGYFTFGEAGKLNRAFTFQDVPARYWQDEPPGTGTPEHPVQKLFEDPDVYEFGMHFENATLPIGYDTSFWYEGLTVSYNPFNWIVVQNIRFYYQHFFRILLFGYIILIFVSNKPLSSLSNLLKNWSLLVPGIAILGVYAIGKDFHYFDPEDADTRLLAPFIVLLFAGFFSSVRLPNVQQSQKLVIGLVVGTFILLGSQLTSNWEHPGSPIHWKVAQQLHQLGIEAGDEVAVVQLGPNRPATTEYWARLARVRVVAEITDSERFWQVDEVVKTKIYQLINQTGAKAIICKQDSLLSALASAKEWVRVSNTDYYIYLFND
ncbi:hypothetical protein Lepto7375DRAFT_0471 [Leptolyngbya sp. PCC 7375]|nr:hypothetical protein Lepto7375DRAFT_0471 [Leptolyngbya sp. PCC 7375]